MEHLLSWHLFLPDPTIYFSLFPFASSYIPVLKYSSRIPLLFLLCTLPSVICLFLSIFQWALPCKDCTAPCCAEFSKCFLLSLVHRFFSIFFFRIYLSFVHPFLLQSQHAEPYIKTGFISVLYRCNFGLLFN